MGFLPSMGASRMQQERLHLLPWLWSAECVLTPGVELLPTSASTMPQYRGTTTPKGRPLLEPDILFSPGVAGHLGEQLILLS